MQVFDDFDSQERKLLRLDEDAIEVSLDPGDYFVGDANHRVRTLLGSCVSMVLWHERMQCGAMCHFLLAVRKKGERSGTGIPVVQKEGKYADEVLELMMADLKQLKVPLHECIAKVFGGGNMFPDQKMADSLNIGMQNGEAAKRLLQKHGFPIVAEDLYGIGHREVIFNIKNGDIWVRQVGVPH